MLSLCLLLCLLLCLRLCLALRLGSRLRKGKPPWRMDAIDSCRAGRCDGNACPELQSPEIVGVTLVHRLIILAVAIRVVLPPVRTDNGSLS